MIDEAHLRGSPAYLEHPGLFGLPGLEQMRLFVQRRLPGPPLHHLSGLAPVEVDAGTVTFTMPAAPCWCSAAGVFPGGVDAFVADAALGGAILTALPPRTAPATSELSMNFLRPATPDSGALVARGRVVQVGRRQGLSEATVEDARGRLLAHGTSRCVLRSIPVDPPDLPDPLPPVPARDDPDPDPYLRPAEGEVISHAVWSRTSGLEIVQSWVKGDRPLPPFCRLVSSRPVEVAEGSVSWAMPASGWFSTSYGTFYGGAIVLFVDGAINAAVTTTIPAGTSYGTLDLKVNFLRPVTPDGRDLLARATVVHRGRTIAVTQAEVEDADGRRVAMATSSAMILPGRPWAPTGPGDILDQTLGDEARG